jgi:hypothetical protein
LASSKREMKVRRNNGFKYRHKKFCEYVFFMLSAAIKNLLCSFTVYDGGEKNLEAQNFYVIIKSFV